MYNNNTTDKKNWKKWLKKVKQKMNYKVILDLDDIDKRSVDEKKKRSNNNLSTDPTD